MEKAQEALRAGGVRCYTYDVRGLPEKGDISDAILAGLKNYTPEAVRNSLMDAVRVILDADKPKPRSLSSAELTDRVLIDITRRMSGEIKGLPWPGAWTKLGRDLGPIEPGSFTIIAARPSVGKTMMAQQLQAHLGDKGYRVLFVTRELTAERLGRRHIVREGGDMVRLRDGDLQVEDQRAIDTYVDRQKKWDVWYDFESRGVDDIFKEAAILEPDCIIIDYLQRLAYDTENEYAAITRIVNEVQDVVIDLNVPVILVSQLRRPMPGKEHVAPSSSDTRGSGAVEERATNLVLLHRKWETTKDDNGRTVASRPTKEGLFIIAKNADGPSGGAIPVLFKGDRMQVFEREDRLGV
jgi:replicative DNA helicase